MNTAQRGKHKYAVAARVPAAPDASRKRDFWIEFNGSSSVAPLPQTCHRSFAACKADDSPRTAAATRELTGHSCRLAVRSKLAHHDDGQVSSMMQGNWKSSGMPATYVRDTRVAWLPDMCRPSRQS